MNAIQSSALLVLTLFALTLIAAEPDPGAPGSVNNLMLTVIKPATNTVYSFQYMNAAELPVPAGVRYSAW